MRHEQRGNDGRAHVSVVAIMFDLRLHLRRLVLQHLPEPHVHVPKVSAALLLKLGFTDDLVGPFVVDDRLQLLLPVQHRVRLGGLQLLLRAVDVGVVARKQGTNGGANGPRVWMCPVLRVARARMIVEPVLDPLWTRTISVDRVRHRGCVHSPSSAKRE